MKKLLYTLAGLSALALFASCNKEAESPTLSGDRVTATFTVAAPEGVATKAAIGDGTKATELTVAVYDEQKNYLQDLSESADINRVGLTWTVSMKVIKDLTYQFVFIAKKEAAVGAGFCHFDAENAKISIDYNAVAANSDDADFFFVQDKFKVEESFSKPETMQRPLAQVNFGASDLTEAGYSINTETMLTGVKLTGIYSEMNVLNEEVIGTAGEVTFTQSARVPAESPKFVDGYDRVAMVYALVAKENQSNVTATLNVKAKSANAANTQEYPITREVANVPLKRNYRTNILGNLFTSDFTFTVNTAPGFYSPEYNEQAGVTIAKANAAFAAGQTSLTIDTAPETADDGETTIKLPATSSAVRIRLNFTTSQTITIQYAAGATDAQKPATVELYAKQVAAVTADLPKTTVTVTTGSLITTGTFATAPATLIIENSAEVTNLMIKAGKVKLEKGSKVTSIGRTEDNGDGETIVEVEGGLASYPSLNDAKIKLKKEITGVTIEKTETKATYSVSAEAIPETALEAIVQDINEEPKETVSIEMAPGSSFEWKTGAGIGSTPIVPGSNTVTKEVVIDGGGTGEFVATGSGVGNVRAAGDGTLLFKNMVIKDHSVSYAESSWEYGYLEFSGKIRFENCTIKSSISLESASDTEEDIFTFADCKFISDTEATEWLPTPSNMYLVWVSDGKASFTNCDFTGYRGIKIHEAYGSDVKEVIVDGCIFHDISKKPGIAIGNLNAGTKVSITNSSFVNCQAGDQKLYAYETDTPVANFDFVFENNTVQIAEGISQTGNIYNVTGAAANTAIASVYSNAKSQGFSEFTVNLPAGEFTLSSPEQSNASIHIAGAGADTKLSLGSREVSYPGATIDFSNLTMVGDSDTDFMKEHGLTHLTKETYSNVTFTKFRFFYAPECTLNNCKFVQDAYDYAFCSYGITTMVLNDCEIECVGKAVKVYGVNASNPSTVTFNRCKFNADGSARQAAGKDWKAAAEIDARAATNTPFTVNFNETVSCTGFYTSENTAIEKTDANYQGTLYNVDNGSGSKIVVNIDGAQQTQAW